MELDNIDLAILEFLTEDARISFREIARELKVSPDTISNRFKEMKKEGVIVGSTVIINPANVGYSFVTRFAINVKPAYSQQILEEIIKVPSVIVATRIVGDHDLIAISVTKNFHHINEIRDRIIEMPYVEKIDTSMWIETMEIKPSFFLI